jgi:NTE family protein
VKGLVFGGGGLVGLAWGIGWLDGLSAADGSLADADVVVGTSAGSALTAMVDATDRSRVAQALQLVPALGAGAGEPPAAIALCLAMSDAEPGTVQAIGRAALAAATIGEGEWRGLVGMLAGQIGRDWARQAAITATDADTGERVVLRGGDAPLADAIAASTAVPGVLPVVSVAGRRLMDGGVRSTTNADVARDAGAGRVLVVRLVPASAPEGPYANRPARLAEEMAGVGHVLEVAPADLPEGDLMDPALVSPAYTAGYWQGKEGAPGVLAFWRA